jgi:2,2-dialkylglycine decarboxylase (pyruvate)
MGTSMKNMKNSISLWEEYGEYVLWSTNFQDNVLKKGRGCRITDVDGNSFIDLESGQICSIVGHNHPYLINKISETMEELLHCGTAFLTKPVFEAAKKMAEIAPGDLKKSIFLSTGAEANECAFRMAKLLTGKQGLVGFTKGYAGLSHTTLAIGGSSNDASLVAPGVLKMLAPSCSNCPVHSAFPKCDFLCLKVSQEFLASHCRDGIAAFVVEPILSAGGMIFPPDGYFKRLQEVVKQFGALLITDEAQTGMGRTGTWFGLENDEVIPDMIVFSKGCGGGFPSAGVIVNDTIASGLLGRFSNFSSHQSDPTAASAISAVIDVIRSEDLLSNVKNIGSYFLSKLEILSNEFGVIKNVRGQGLMIGADANAINGMDEGAVGFVFENLCRLEGVHLKSIHQGKIFRILPPLNISEDDIDEVIDVFAKTMKKIVDDNYDKKDFLSVNTYKLEYEKATSNELNISRVIKKGWQSSPSDLSQWLARKIKK